MHNEVSALVDDLSESLGLPVQLTDARMNSLAFGPHVGPIDWIRRETVLALTTSAEVRAYLEQFGVSSATGPIRIPPDPVREVMGRVVVPIHARKRTLGFLWFLDDNATLTGARLDQAVTAAERIAHLLDRDEQAQRLLRRALWELLGPQAQSRLEAARYLLDHHLFPDRCPAAVVVVAPDGAAVGPDFAAVAPALTAPHGLPRTVLCAVADTHAVAVVPVTRPDSPARVAERAVRVIADASAGTVTAVVGVGAAESTLAAAVMSYRQARSAVRAARCFPDYHPVAHWDTLGGLRALTSVPADLAVDAVDPRLRPVLRERLLVETLEAYLASAGDIKQTCARLNVHRGTVYYRLRKVETLSGMSLRNGEHRLAMHLGLHLARLAELI